MSLGEDCLIFFNLLHKEKHSAAVLCIVMSHVFGHHILLSSKSWLVGLYIFNLIISGSTQRLPVYLGKKWMISKTTKRDSFLGAWNFGALRLPFEAPMDRRPRDLSLTTVWDHAWGLAHWKERSSPRSWRRAKDVLKRWCDGWEVGGFFFLEIFGKLTKLY